MKSRGAGGTGSFEKVKGRQYDLCRVCNIKCDGRRFRNAEILMQPRYYLKKRIQLIHEARVVGQGIFL